MTWDITTAARSLADYLAPHFPGVQFAEGPHLQGGRYPAMFLQQRFANLKLKQGGRLFQTIGLDLTYLVQYNLSNMQRLYETAAGRLDLLMETFPYSDGSGGRTLLRTYEREWRIDLDALHYKFELRLWLEAEPDNDPLMTKLAADIAVTEKRSD